MNKQLTLMCLSALLSLPARAEPLSYRAQVDGLACPFCVHGVEKKLGRLDGVEKIESELKAGEILIRMREGKALTEQQVREAVTAAGFTLRALVPAEEAEK